MLDHQAEERATLILGQVIEDSTCLARVPRIEAEGPESVLAFILEPIGGPWKDGEVLAFPRNARENIDTLANDTLRSLLSDRT